VPDTAAVGEWSTNQAIDEPMLKRLGASGILRSSEQGLQVVLGPSPIKRGRNSRPLRAPMPRLPTPRFRRLPWRRRPSIRRVDRGTRRPRNVIDFGNRREPSIDPHGTT